MWTGFIDLVYPPRCVVCRGSGSYFCQRCLAQCGRLGPSVCPRCGDPVSTDPTVSDVGAAVTACDTCRLHPRDFDQARSLFIYEGPIREAVHALKYHGCRAVARSLGLLLAEYLWDAAAGTVECVVPVPLHPGRLVTRGFNQAELLARPVAHRLRVPCLARALCRVHHAQSQTGLAAEARRANVEQAFRPGPAAVRGRVLLVDDVFSTGATAAACARVLRSCGAHQVRVLTLARAVLRPDSDRVVSAASRRSTGPA